MAAWDALSLDGARVVARPCLVHRGGSEEIAPAAEVAVSPRVLFTTWGVDWEHRPLFESILAATGARHTESSLLSWLDGKSELERCLRAHERRTGVRVSRPATALSEELADGSEPPEGELVIVKPSRGGQCRGIEVVRRETVATLAAEAAAGARPPFVAQSLVDPIRLYRGRRWDVRLHALATELYPVRHRLFREGVAKTAGAVAKPGSADLDEWLNAESHLEGIRPAENLCLTDMLRVVIPDRARRDDLWRRMDELAEALFAAIATAAESWPASAERPVLLPGIDVIVARGADGAAEPMLLELNSHPGLGWDPPIAGCLAAHHRLLFEELEALP